MIFPLSQDWADQFGRDWISAWNSHNLDRICGHYASEVEFASPFVISLTGDPKGIIRGLPALRSYFQVALEKFPTLQFSPIFVCAGVSTITLIYHSVNNLIAAETMEIDGQGRVFRIYAQYSRKSKVS